MNIRERLENLDALKGVSIYFVIVLHSLPIINSEKSPLINDFLVNLSRFAVPCFFIISGYLSGEKAMQDKYYAIKIIKRIILLFLFWNLFYLAAPMNIDKMTEFGYLKIKYWDCYKAFMAIFGFWKVWH
jgi:surface polysaccharide O-acyltransferase-like enzyme